MKSSESNPPVKTKPREAEVGPEEEAFPEELMRLARPPKGITAEVKDGVLTIRRRWYVEVQEELIGGLKTFLVHFGLVIDTATGSTRKPTALMAAGDVLQVKYSPIDPTAPREFRTDMTHQIFVVASQNWYTASEAFTVKARLHSGEHVVLLKGLTKPQAKFIEHRLEAFLGIANQRVEGEVED